MGVVTDSIEFDTKKSLEEIANILRSCKGRIEKIQVDDPLGGIGSSRVDIAVIIWNHVSFNEGFVKALIPGHSSGASSDWGVQVFVTDNGSSRQVELIALGEKGFGRVVAANQGYRSFKLGFSKDHRDKIAQLLAY